MTCEFGSVVLVPFPFTAQNALKKRPAVVVSSADYTANRPDLILIAVTSQVRSPLLFGEAPIIQWQGAGLLKPSVIGLVPQAPSRRLGAIGCRWSVPGRGLWAGKGLDG